jgi:hypothetical protein
LRSIGINTPLILYSDLQNGIALVEETGCESFGDQKRKTGDVQDIYAKAVDVLLKIKASTNKNTIPLVGYRKTLIRSRLRQFVDFYIPNASDVKATPELADEFENILNNIALDLPPCPSGFCHADFHLENLMWCPDKKGGYSLIDFQDAFWGFQGYDLLNLLEDARQTVPDNLKRKMRDRYCENMNGTEREVFDKWYALMSMHFHCRVIGLFIKFATENNRLEFLDHIPRLQGYIKQNLENPIFLPLKKWLDKNNVSFAVKIKNGHVMGVSDKLRKTFS